MKTVYWVRTDLRVQDNLSLRHFSHSNSPAFAFWCPSLSFLRAERFRKNFILESLFQFQIELRKLNIDLLILKTPLHDVLSQWPNKDDYEVIFSEEFCPEEISEQRQVLKTFVKSQHVDQNSLVDLTDLPFTIKSLPEIFTQFRKRIESEVKITLLDRFQETLKPITPLKNDPAFELFKTWPQYSVIDKTSDSHPLIKGGESEGLRRLQDYIWNLDRLKTYKDTRNGMIEWNDSSKLSPWLSVGALSPKRIFSEIKRYELERVKNESTYWLFFELLWRDYFRFVCLKKGSEIFLKKPLTKKLGENLEAQLFEKWKTGNTDNDFINANMNELNQTGWMSNRGRQNVASYLAKTLGVNWILGAQYFESLLVDYDAASNWGNWSYLAGVGQDPRDRKFNPDLQASIYDPGGIYRKTWLN